MATKNKNISVLFRAYLFKNVSKGPAFFQDELKFKPIQTIEYGLDDAMRIKKKDFLLDA